MFGYQLFTSKKCPMKHHKQLFCRPVIAWVPATASPFSSAVNARAVRGDRHRGRQDLCADCGRFKRAGMEFDRFHQVSIKLRRYYSNYQLELMLLQPNRFG
jgi:hypothetical protein